MSTTRRSAEADLEFQLTRIKYIYATEQLHAAAVEADFASRSELTVALRGLLSKRNMDAAPIIAGAALLALDVTFDRWQQDDGRRPLASLIEEAFTHVGQLESTT